MFPVLLDCVSGKLCNINVDDCQSAPCMNGGTCKDQVAGYLCVCPKGITGQQCEINEDNCASGPCQNEATCADGAGTFQYVYIFLQPVSTFFCVLLLIYKCSLFWHNYFTVYYYENEN